MKKIFCLPKKGVHPERERNQCVWKKKKGSKIVKSEQMERMREKFKCNGHQKCLSKFLNLMEMVYTDTELLYITYNLLTKPDLPEFRVRNYLSLFF